MQLRCCNHPFLFGGRGARAEAPRASARLRDEAAARAPLALSERGRPHQAPRRVQARLQSLSQLRSARNPRSCCRASTCAPDEVTDSSCGRRTRWCCSTRSCPSRARAATAPHLLAVHRDARRARRLLPPARLPLRAARRFDEPRAARRRHQRVQPGSTRFIFLMSTRAGGLGINLPDGRHGHPVRLGLEPAGRPAGDGPRAPHRPDAPRARVPAHHRGHGRGARLRARAEEALPRQARQPRLDRRRRRSSTGSTAPSCSTCSRSAPTRSSRATAACRRPPRSTRSSTARPTRWAAATARRARAANTKARRRMAAEAAATARRLPGRGGRRRRGARRRQRPPTTEAAAAADGMQLGQTPRAASASEAGRPISLRVFRFSSTASSLPAAGGDVDYDPSAGVGDAARVADELARPRKPPRSRRRSRRSPRRSTRASASARVASSRSTATPCSRRTTTRSPAAVRFSATNANEFPAVVVASQRSA